MDITHIGSKGGCKHRYEERGSGHSLVAPFLVCAYLATADEIACGCLWVNIFTYSAKTKKEIAYPAVGRWGVSFETFSAFPICKLLSCWKSAICKSVAVQKWCKMPENNMAISAISDILRRILTVFPRQHVVWGKLPRKNGWLQLASGDDFSATLFLDDFNAGTIDRGFCSLPNVKK